jgi:hypothetical protein
MTRARNRLFLAALVLALSGCGSDDGDSGSPTTTSPTTAAGFEFTGYLFRSGGQTRICDAILESYPPQCGGKRYEVVGLDVATVEGVQKAQGVTWTERPVTLKGVVADDGATLVVSPNAARGDGPPPPTGEGQPGSAPG